MSKISKDIAGLSYKINYYRLQMDECWIELETANTWEQINEISNRLQTAGLEYKRLKAIKEALLSENEQPVSGMRAAL